MTKPEPRPLLSARSVFIAAAILALGFAWGTGHVWEDYFITWKSSRHLATGHGLVYHVGEWVHTFTSPLGVLLPALCSLLTLNRSDEAALWLFRILSITAFAGGAAMVFRTACTLRWHRFAAVATVVWMITDAKSLDFTINGMETGLLLFFVAYTLWSLFACGHRRWLHLGLAWAGLMWTRPDGFIYIGAVAAGVLLFNDRNQSGPSRQEWMKLMGRAALVCAVLYLPWFVSAWVCYGSPVPHTVIAKANAAGPKSLMGALWMLFKLPVACWTGVTSVDGTFMPSLHTLGGWPHAALLVSRSVGSVGALLWLLPFLRWHARVASFVYFVLAAYLAYFPGHPAAWYLPGPAWLALFAIGSALSSWLKAASPGPWKWKIVPLAVAVLFAAFGGWLALETARHAWAQQTIVDGGNRRAIGLWLKEHAAPQESVFMECLGYIGYYSGIKTFDFPGLSSPEVVQAAKEVGFEWHRLIRRLDPDWLVLRPWEASSIMAEDAALLGRSYEFVRTFDVTDQTSRLDARGHGLLMYDSVFIVFHRKRP